MWLILSVRCVLYLCHIDHESVIFVLWVRECLYAGQRDVDKFGSRGSGEFLGRSYVLHDSGVAGTKVHVVENMSILNVDEGRELGHHSEHH